LFYLFVGLVNGKLYTTKYAQFLLTIPNNYRANDHLWRSFKGEFFIVSDADLSPISKEDAKDMIVDNTKRSPSKATELLTVYFNGSDHAKNEVEIA